jgi:hypothetical protein
VRLQRRADLRRAGLRRAGGLVAQDEVHRLRHQRVGRGDPGRWRRRLGDLPLEPGERIAGRCLAEPEAEAEADRGDVAADAHRRILACAARGACPDRLRDRKEA